MVAADEGPSLREHASRLPSLQLSERAVCDLELLATGAFSPLDRFMGYTDFESSMHTMRLASGHIFPIPISLPVSAESPAHLDSEIALRDARNDLLAVMTVEEIYEWDQNEFSECVLGTRDLRHPLNSELGRWGMRNISGKLRVLALPSHFDFKDLRLTPHQTRERLALLYNPNVVAFQTRNPMHRGHEEVCRRAMDSSGGTLLLHPTVGLTRLGDVDSHSRVRTYKAVVEKYFEHDSALLSAVPLAMRMAGPREAVWHMLIRRNYGANHFIVGRDHASPGMDSHGDPFYAPTAARELAEQFSEELCVKTLAFDEMVYLPDDESYQEKSVVGNSASYYEMSGTKMREQLAVGADIPDWFARPEVAEILRKSVPPSHQQGVCIWFTGLSAAGKSTIAEILTTLLNERGRNVTLLDGDVVRTHLSKGLGFTREDRDANVLRIGFVASEVVKHNGIAVCAAVSPYQAARDSVRRMFDPGRFVEVFVDTPISVCEQRDIKGMYARARRSDLKGFTGVDDPYERPVAAEIILDTEKYDAEENADEILRHLERIGIVEP